MPAVRRAHHRAGRERLEQRRVMPSGQRRKIGGGVDQLVTEPRRRLAGRVAPQPRAAGFRVARSETLGRVDMRGEASPASGTASASIRSATAEAGFEAVDKPPQTGRSLPRLSSASLSPAKPGRRPRSPDRRFETPRALAERCRRQPAGRKRVFQRRQQRHRGECAAARSSTRRRNTPGGVRSSGTPAESSMSMSQRRNSAATRRASSRSGVTSAAVVLRRFELPPQQQGDRHPLVLGAGAVIARHPIEPRPLPREIAQKVRRQGAAPARWSPPPNAPRGSAAPRASSSAGGRGRAGRGRARVADIATLGGRFERLEQGDQMLGMRSLAGDRGPLRRARAAVEAGQDNRAAIEAATTGAGRTAPACRPQPSRDDRSGGGPGATVGPDAQQAVAPVGRVDRALGLQYRRPQTRQDFEKVETTCQCSASSPAPARAACSKLASSARRRCRAAARARRPARRLGRAAAGPSVAALQPSTSRVSSSRRRNSGIAGGTDSVGLGGALGQESRRRRDRRSAAAGAAAAATGLAAIRRSAQERLAQRAHRAPGRQQNGHPRQAQRRRRQHISPSASGRQERPVGRDCVDAGLHEYGIVMAGPQHAPFAAALVYRSMRCEERRARVVASPSGVPT